MQFIRKINANGQQQLKKKEFGVLVSVVENRCISQNKLASQLNISKKVVSQIINRHKFRDYHVKNMINCSIYIFIFTASLLFDQDENISGKNKIKKKESNNQDKVVNAIT